MNFLKPNWFMGKTEVVCDGGMVVAMEDEASLAGAQVLAEGGNAIDAIVAAGFVMAVMQPYNCGIGGSGYLIYREASGKSHVIDFSPRAPEKATWEAVQACAKPTYTGPLAAAVPGYIAGMALAVERFGTMKLPRLMRNAIRLAEEMPLHWLMTQHITHRLVELRKNPWTAKTFLIDNDPPFAHGATTIRQTDLARTLRTIADEGPRAFYEGPIADEIINYVNSRGGILQRSDFSRFELDVSEPIRMNYNGYDLIAPPQPCPAVMTFQVLKMLEGFGMKQRGHNTLDSLHILIESIRMGFADRDTYFGDPEFSLDVTDRLLDEDYIARRAKQIDMKRAMDRVLPGDIGYPVTREKIGAGGTTHLTTVDAAGNAVSMTQTLIGSMWHVGIAGNTGVFMNGCLNWFDTGKDSANGVAPFKRPVANMAPMLVEKDGKLFMTMGAPGSRRIGNAVMQVTQNILEYGMGMQDGISAPRVDFSQGIVCADDRIAADVLDRLAKRGHTVKPVWEFLNSGTPETEYRANFARPCGILIDDKGLRHGGDYPMQGAGPYGVPRQ